MSSSCHTPLTNQTLWIYLDSSASLLTKNHFAMSSQSASADTSKVPQFVVDPSLGTRGSIFTVCSVPLPPQQFPCSSEDRFEILSIQYSLSRIAGDGTAMTGTLKTGNYVRLVPEDSAPETLRLPAETTKLIFAQDVPVHRRPSLEDGNPFLISKGDQLEIVPTVYGLARYPEADQSRRYIVATFELGGTVTVTEHSQILHTGQRPSYWPGSVEDSGQDNANGLIGRIMEEQLIRSPSPM
jgi:hypothetical protein